MNFHINLLKNFHIILKNKFIVWGVWKYILKNKYVKMIFQNSQYHNLSYQEVHDLHVIWLINV